MTTWEIRFHEQPPVRVELDDDRNLGEEFALALTAYLDPPKPRGRRKPTPPSPVWHVCEDHHYHLETVVGLRRVTPPSGAPRRKRPIGFQPPSA